MANPLLTNALDLAEHTASGIWKKNIKGGIIGSLTWLALPISSLSPALQKLS